MSDAMRRALLALTVLALIMVLGTIGYVVIEGWPLLNAFFMTVITMSTVGFSEVEPLDGAGRILTIALILSTVLVGGYTLGSISAFLIGGEIGNIMRGRRLEKMLGRMKDHIILVACGRVGREVLSGFNSSDKVVVVDRDPATLKEAESAKCLTVEGDATHESVLREAGIERARGIIVATGNVADNVLICLTARELNPGIIIAARGDDPGSERKLRRAGADKVVLPNKIGGMRLAAFLKQPAVVDFLDLVTHGDEVSLRLQEVRVGDGCPLVGKTLQESDLRRQSGGALVMSMRRCDGRSILAPSSEHKLEAGDLLILLGTEENLDKVSRIVK